MTDKDQTKKSSMNTVGFWVAEKKCKKFGVETFIDKCRKLNMEVIKLDLTKPLDDQGPFDIIIHKITPMYALALDGDTVACDFAVAFEEYLEKCSNTIVMDPVIGVHTLIRRTATYALLKEVTKNDDKITTPPYIELEDCDVSEKRKKLSASGVTFPIVCKPIFGCGTASAHEMAIVLSARRLGEWKGACVAQSFIPHGAKLYKLYVVGDRWHLDVRPSLKNFRATDAPTVHFNSANVSKADSCSPLSKLDERDIDDPTPKPDMTIFDTIVSLVRRSFGMDLIGIDVLINSKTGCYAVIDVNPFPSFDNFPDVHQVLAELAREKIDSKIGPSAKKIRKEAVVDSVASQPVVASGGGSGNAQKEQQLESHSKSSKFDRNDEDTRSKEIDSSLGGEQTTTPVPELSLVKVEGEAEAVVAGVVEEDEFISASVLTPALKTKITNDEYVDFLDFVYPNGQGKKVVKRGGWHDISEESIPEPMTKNTQLSPAAWCEAFDEYAIHYADHHNGIVVADLLRYGQHIKSMIKANNEHWRYYDETFRRQRKALKCPWNKYRGDIRPPVENGTGDSTMSRGVSNFSVPKKITRGYCFNFNTVGIQCKILDCKFKHLCTDCEGSHPVYYHDEVKGEK